ncbi:MAG: hypothetical protein SFY92_10305 [Verrucomicrobiae bacterium]|nr:hypothetical protein [Verrucomicrobiae bacterium]
MDKVRKMAQARLDKAGIAHRLTGGLFLNEQGVGRPTFDIDLIVSRRDWQRAVSALVPMSIGNEKMGLPDEPFPAAILKSKSGPFIEIFPEGLTAGEIAKLRGFHRSPRAEKIALTLQGDPRVNFINSKLASYLSATDRIQDLADIQRLVKHQKLDMVYSKKLHPSVRKNFILLIKSVSVKNKLIS